MNLPFHHHITTPRSLALVYLREGEGGGGEGEIEDSLEWDGKKLKRRYLRGSQEEKEDFFFAILTIWSWRMEVEKEDLPHLANEQPLSNKQRLGRESKLWKQQK